MASITRSPIPAKEFPLTVRLPEPVTVASKSIVKSEPLASVTDSIPPAVSLRINLPPVTVSVARFFVGLVRLSTTRALTVSLVKSRLVPSTAITLSKAVPRI